MAQRNQNYCVSLLFALSSTSVFAAATTPQKSVVAPWIYRGVVPELVAAHKKDLETAKTAIDQKILTGGSPINARLNSEKPRFMGLIIEHFLGGFTEGTTSSPKPVFIQPVWCTAGEWHVISLIASDMETFEFIGAADRQYSKDRLKGAFNAAVDLVPNIQSILSAPRTTSPLAVEIRSSKDFTRVRDGSASCLNLMLAKSLAQKSRIITPIGRENWRAIYRPAGGSPNAKRATRAMVVDWSPPRSARGQLTADVNLRLADTVLGQPLPSTTHKDTLALAVPADDTSAIASTIGAPVQKLMNDEATPLNSADNPMAARIDRAWVYLDRGRAYGLTMDARMVDAANGQIKGHIVGFFGPELGIKSPRGYTIEEGAILFVRNGQTSTKVGEEFAFDPKTYPSQGATELGH